MTRDKVTVLSCSLLLVLLGIQLAETTGTKKDCMIDDAVGWYVLDNVYQCESDSKCCKEYGKPSCCKSKDTTVIIRDQAILWGGLLGFLASLGLIIFCKRSDFYVMEGDKKCCCRGRAQNPDEVQRLEEKA